MDPVLKRRLDSIVALLCLIFVAVTYQATGPIGILLAPLGLVGVLVFVSVRSNRTSVTTSEHE
ncbi:hypothetical protein KU306_07800 [Haloferax larsenii]|uniref:Uncharacterized protein n=1 Tax=Haloferax larsenii TaxID=302484 RepID=A0ABY5RH87_HALLR|nr:hypothetical protein [Haloferax larsenii]ELZ74718.1 hypothetical protein C455_17287 [Haloferax larsenii JCM 13917]UVE51757.1 hypothetical protein KU306_07800 [Haloferax larsenii]